MAVKQWPTWLVCLSKHKEWRVYITKKYLLIENRTIKSSYPLFEGFTTEVALDRLCAPLASLGGHTGGLGLLQLGATLKQGMLLIMSVVPSSNEMWH